MRPLSQTTRYEDRVEIDYPEERHTYYDFDGIIYTKLDVLSKSTGNIYTKDVAWRQSDEYITRRYKSERGQQKRDSKKGRVWVQLFKENARRRITNKVSFSAKGLFLELLLCLNKGSGRVIHPLEHYAFTPITLAEYLNESVTNIRRWLNELQSAGAVLLVKENPDKKTSPQHIFVNHQVAFSGSILSSEKELEYFDPNKEILPIGLKVNTSPSFSVGEISKKPKQKNQKGRSPNLSVTAGTKVSDHRVEGVESLAQQEATEPTQLDHPRSNVDHARSSCELGVSLSETAEPKAAEPTQLDHPRSSYPPGHQLHDPILYGDPAEEDLEDDDFTFDDIAPVIEKPPIPVKAANVEDSTDLPIWIRDMVPNNRRKKLALEAARKGDTKMMGMYLQAITEYRLRETCREECQKLIPQAEPPAKRRGFGSKALGE
jgi:hypothetical protein